MSLPNLSGTARLTGEPELRFTPQGTAMCKVPLAFNSRKKNDAGEWVDGDTLFITGTVWKDAAEAAAEHLRKGQEVAVTGRPKTRSWESDGQKRSTIELLIDSIGPTLRTLAKSASREKPAGKTATGEGDPWAAGPSDEPPF